MKVLSGMEINTINLEEAKLIVHKLAFRWFQAKLLGEHMDYVDYMQAVNGLLATTRSAK